MKTTTKINDIQFPTHANGVVGCTVLLELTPELQKYDCGGVGLSISKHTFNNNFLPYAPGNEIEIEFTDKGEIKKYEIRNPEKLFIALPTKCVTCQSDLEKITDKDFGLEGELICKNYLGCTAQATSPVYRLAKVASKGNFTDEDFVLFATYYPDGNLTHLSDLKVLLQDDPNTAPRQEIWEKTPAKNGWEVEKYLWELLNSNSIEAEAFWYVGFNLENVKHDPRVVMQKHNSVDYQDIIENNIIRVQQLINFFDYWKPKSYVV